MARGRFQRGRGGSIVAHKEWLAVSAKIDGLDIAVGIVGLGNLGIQHSSAATVLRLRGSVFCELNAGAVNERVLVSVGLIVVGSNAFQAGAGSVPSPATDSDADWMWFEQLSVSSLEEGAVVNDALFDRVKIDSKAMRKVKPDDVVVFVVEVAQSTDQTGTVDLMYMFRELVGV